MSETEDRVVEIGEKSDSEFNRIISNMFGHHSIIHRLSNKEQCKLSIKQLHCDKVTVIIDAAVEFNVNEKEKIHFSSNVPIKDFNKASISISTDDLPASTLYFGTWELYNNESYIMYVGDNGDLIINRKATFIGTYVWSFLLLPLFVKESTWTKFENLKEFAVK
ncbi:hypothetical protein EHQ81_08465 [Leptospira selangorensis]|uniref:Uncharacterized protein n=2 Tax=Leptospira selangorensis TaxID=2484982 RepID=A0A5F2BXV6_9LEPT|nr:hypothetical protein EHQ81_08465 [Leptospira selangorensis]TGM16889.1 hypothetical protein EHQ82_16830 [Leptospira selangorensis]